MRLTMGIVMGLAVLLLAFWAYQENYRTRQALADARAIQAEIGRLQERRVVLRAEWAWLNRPERLRDLAELNYEKLGLGPMEPEHFGSLDQVAYPPADPLPLQVDAPGQPIDAAAEAVP